jgi:hypothetical protein
VSQRLSGLAALLLAACGGARGEFGTGSERDGVQPEPTAGDQAAGAEQLPSRGPAPVIDGNTLITLERTQCFGVCPAYSLSIAGDGSVHYVGAQFVKVVGEASSQVAVSGVQSLVDQMWDAGYLDMNEPSPCDVTWTDAPSVITSLSLGGHAHRVSHYHGNPCAPASLTTIEDRIDELAGSERWLRCDTPSGYCSPSY